ncbi:MAG TPA: TIGR03067 domain-containing protein [Gemmataceae bacterium]|jgi:uncharacterized protein (TIGR03067 family)
MRLRVTLLVAAGLLLAADAPKATDHDKIQGEWKITAEVQNGKETPAARNEKVRIRFTADKMIVSEGDEKHAGAYKLDPDKKPSTITVTPDDGPKKGKKGVGIYQLSGDTLTICLTLKEGKDPPSDFTAKADSGRVMLTLERIKP